jgi:hypothetical protein
MNTTNTVIIVILVSILLIMLFNTHVTVVQTNPVQPIVVPKPVPYVKPIGGCAGTRYGCCPNGTTSRVDSAGSNC